MRRDVDGRSRVLGEPEAALRAPSTPLHPPTPSHPPTLYVLFAPESDGVKIAWGAEEKFSVSLAADPERRPLAATLAARTLMK